MASGLSLRQETRPRIETGADEAPSLEIGTMLTTTQATLFRRLTLGDPLGLDPLLHGSAPGDRAATGWMPSLSRLAALIALDASIAAYQREVNGALAAGADAEDIIGVLRAVTSIVGSAHVMSAAPRLALALGYDVDQDIERLAPLDER